jgi:hypothetical protein
VPPPKVFQVFIDQQMGRFENVGHHFRTLLPDWYFIGVAVDNTNGEASRIREAMYISLLVAFHENASAGSTNCIVEKDVVNGLVTSPDFQHTSIFSGNDLASEKLLHYVSSHMLSSPCFGLVGSDAPFTSMSGKSSVPCFTITIFLRSVRYIVLFSE